MHKTFLKNLTFLKQKLILLAFALIVIFNMKSFADNIDFKPKYHRHECIIGFEYKGYDSDIFNVHKMREFLLENAPKSAIYAGKSGRSFFRSYQVYYMQFADNCENKFDVGEMIASHLKSSFVGLEIKMILQKIEPGKDTIDSTSNDLWLPDN